MKNRLIRTATTSLLSLSLCTAIGAQADAKTVLIQSTTSTANSGLYDYLLPAFEQENNIKVNVVAVGTGQAIRNARNCDADVLLVHAKAAEEAFVAEGFGVERFDVMYNDFVIVGPASDPAGIRGSENVQSAFRKIADNEALFASRGDDSGTHKKEMSLWENAGVNAEASGKTWYRSTGSGMGATINTAVGLGAYALTDRATWIGFKNKSDYQILLEGDTVLFNQYGVTLVNENKCPSVNAESGQQFIDWLLSEAAQNKIAQFQIANQKLFYPNAN